MSDWTGTGVRVVAAPGSIKEILEWVRTTLRDADSLSYIADEDIFITPDEDLVPVSCAFPAIGVKDGPIEMTLDASGQGSGLLWEVRYRIHLIAYVDMTAGETPVIGQASPAIKGALDINDDIRAVLHENYSSLFTGIIDARFIDEGESEVIGSNEMIVLKKRMTIEYWALESIS